MRVVVVGGSGNVGSAVVRRLVAEGVDVVGVSRRAPALDGSFAGARWREIDVADAASDAALVEAFADADAVVHLAWKLQPSRDEQTMWRTNVDGLRRVLRATRDAGVPQIAVASSVGAYSGSTKRRRDENWPTGGIGTSHYSRQKAASERLLDTFERIAPGIVVTRMRPALVFQASAASEIARLFIGPVGMARAAARVDLRLVPLPRLVQTQIVHADDLADAFWRAVDRRIGGAFNIAGEPVLGPDDFASALGGRWVRVRVPPIRRALGAAWRLRLIPLDPGWLDLATQSPLMTTDRARTLLGWSPTHDSHAALAELLNGLAAGAGDDASASLHG